MGELVQKQNKNYSTDKQCSLGPVMVHMNFFGSLSPAEALMSLSKEGRAEFERRAEIILKLTGGS